MKYWIEFPNRKNGLTSPSVSENFNEDGIKVIEAAPVERLVEALKTYGVHSEYCEASYGGHECGLCSALKEWE